jgi:aspartate dehydrogenase
MAAAKNGETRKVGIVGFGKLGQFLYDSLSSSSEFEVVFVWNRSPEKLSSVPSGIVLHDLSQVLSSLPLSSSPLLAPDS